MATLKKKGAAAKPASKKVESEKLNREDVVSLVATKTGYAKDAVREVMGATLDAIMETLTTGKDLTLTGFGTFHLTMTKGGLRKNPMKPTEMLDLPDNNVVRFTAGMPFKRMVNGKEPVAKPGIKAAIATAVGDKAPAKPKK